MPALPATVTAHRDKSRYARGNIVCEQSGFFDSRGRRQRAGRMKALRVLEGKIALPRGSVIWAFLLPGPDCWMRAARRAMS